MAGKYPEVSSVTKIFEVDYDYIIIAVFDRPVYEEIKKELLGQGVQEEKVLQSPTKYENF